jgi:hypothetical protein
MDNNINFIDNTTTDTQAENSNINHNDTHTHYNYPMVNDGDSSASYANTPTHSNISAHANIPVHTNIPDSVPISDLSSQSYPTTLSNSPHPPQHFSQYNGQNAPYSSTPNSLDVTNSSRINHSGIFTFDIPGIKIIIIPIFPPMTNTSQSEIFTLDIPGSKVIIITLFFQ